MFSQNQNLITKNEVNKAVSIDTEAKIPTLDIATAAPTIGVLAYNIVDNRLYYGNGSTWNIVGQGNEAFPIFPGDTVPIEPEYVIAGAGSAGCALAERLVAAGRRVLMLEIGQDQEGNPLVTQPFAPSPLRNPSGAVDLNAYNVLWDPTVSHFNGAPGGPGDGYKLYPLWTGHGIGGGGLHYLLAWVTPVQYMIDGPLPPQIQPWNNVSTFSFAQAGGAAWNYANVSATVRGIENFQLLTGFGTSVVGVSENIADRGTAGPFNAIQLAPPFPVQTTISVAGDVTDAIISVTSNAGFPAAGSIAILTTNNGYQTVAYTGLGVNTITGCTTSGTGLFAIGGLVYLGPFTDENRMGGPFGPYGMTFLIQSAFSNVAASIPGGTACPVVNDYNCNTNFATGQIQLNCTSQLQNGLDNTFIRQNSATAFINGITQPSTDGRIGNSPTNKIIIWTRCTALSVDRDTTITGTYRGSGVRFLSGNTLQIIRGKNIVCSMGAGYSPRFWELSGIGPSAVLTAKNIPVLVDSPLIGSNLSDQYGPGVVLSTTNEYFTLVAFPGAAYTQYNGVGRRVQALPLSLGPISYGYLGQPPYVSDLPPASQTYYYAINNYIVANRARGYAHTLQDQFVGQLDFDWGFFNDVPPSNFTGTIAGTTLTLAVPPAVPLIVGQTIAGANVTPGTLIIATAAPQPTPGVAASYIAPGAGATYTLSVTSAIAVAEAMSLEPTDPLTGLSDVDSDMSVSCASMDNMYEHIVELRILDPTQTYTFASPPGIETLMVIAGIERWIKYAAVIPAYLDVSAHEAGTVVMGSSAASGAVNGNLRLYGTDNCFECSFAIAPVQNSSNPMALIDAIGQIGAQVIDAVAIL
jgi:choline dehydrogenase-like flavoprotein